MWPAIDCFREMGAAIPDRNDTVSVTADFPATASTLPGSNTTVPHLYPDCFGDSNSRQMTIRCIRRTYVKAESQATRKLIKL